MGITLLHNDVREAHAAPEPGQLVKVRDRMWVVSDVARSGQATPSEEPQHLLVLSSVEDDAMGEELRVIWEIEPGRSIIEKAELPAPVSSHFDDPERLDAFLDAVRWGAIASADRALQSPFRAGITIEDYQLDPVVRALRMPRVNLLIADDVGLGKTIEAGLVLQELLLRHRARTVLIVCPASLTVKWRDEMQEKFGLEFRIVDSELLRSLRRTRGLRANPWTHFPRLITSIDWLKRERPMRLMREILPATPDYPREFDLLIVDEAHTTAPSGRGKYATDSLRTRAIRAIAPHFEHRLFLSATPHNGYAESFSALLELLDNQRFARGVKPTPEQLGQAMVRRMKSELREELPPHPDGSPRFPERRIEALSVAYSDEERTIHAKLQEYSASRRKATEKDRRRKLAEEFVLTLLKKRLFSSPAAFARTLATHLQTITGQRSELEKAPAEPILRRAIDEVDSDFATEEELEQAATDALSRAAAASEPPTSEELALIEEMRKWADHAKGRSDSKAEVLLDWIEGIVRQDGQWTDERVIIFTEYRDTQIWLQERLAARGLAGDGLQLLYGGMQTEDRERIKAEFQASPELSPVRILLATDAASEGIDLQRQCHRLVHYEIPWNPNRLEQRNGRIDRHGQRAPEVLIHHFVGEGYEDAEPGSLEADLEFLYMAAQKIEAIRDDIGSVGPVIADQVSEAMLGQRKRLETEEAEKKAVSRKALKVERQIREEIAKLRERLDDSIQALHLTPERVERVVRTALALDHQSDLEPTTLPGDPDASAFRLPPLTGSWARTAEGLQHPVTEAIRPITFSHEVAEDRDDVVLSHLQHPLVQRAMRLLRAQIWASGGDVDLARVSARVVPRGALEAPAIVAFGRLVVTGGDGHRLHEEVIEAGGLIRNERFGRLNVGEVQAALETASDQPPTIERYQELAALWPKIAEAVLTALERRARDRADSLKRALAERAERDEQVITQVLAELAKSIKSQLKEPEHEQLALFTPDEREQLRRDIDALKRRLEEIPSDIERETRAIGERYADPEPRLFPAAVTFLIPEGA
jgi:SNF2 family DNA or RNA helicase